MVSATESVEMQEILQKLTDAGYSKIVDAFLSNENKVYTKKGRLNQSGACRILGCKPKELREILEKCKEVIGSDYEIFN
jgi:metal-dependent hydrolase (beta-lactamase superfamily II)